jgi:hypothetical protein
MTITIPMPEWYKLLSGNEKVIAYHRLDQGLEVEVDVEYHDGTMISAKLVV